MLNFSASPVDCFLARLRLQPAQLVRIAATQGSVPREAGAWMAVFADAVIGTIGGGHLEHQAIALARTRLAAAGQGREAAGQSDAGRPDAWQGRHGTHANDVDRHGADSDNADGRGAGSHETRQPASGSAASWPEAPALVRFALGPSLGQCCGGVVQLAFSPVSAADLPALAQALRPVLTPLALFGAGHVGQALVRVLVPLPFSLTWIDSREDVFPQALAPQVVPEPAHNAGAVASPVLAPQVVCESSDPVQAAVPGLAPQSRVLIMSFSHAEDLEVLAACLKRQREQADLPYIGLIGSATKWATFRHRLQMRGFSDAELAHVTCPIGVPGIDGKAPEIIAVAVAAQVLQTLGGP